MILAAFEFEPFRIEQAVQAPQMAQLPGVTTLDADDLHAELHQEFAHLASDVGGVDKLPGDEIVEADLLLADPVKAALACFHGLPGGALDDGLELAGSVSPIHS